MAENVARFCINRKQLLSLAFLIIYQSNYRKSVELVMFIQQNNIRHSKDIEPEKLLLCHRSRKHF